MHSLDLLLTLTGGLAGALVLGYVTQRIGLSPIVGYLLAGVLVGPNTPGFVVNTVLAEQFAEVGVILLMFGVGLQFHVEELVAVWRIAVPGAVAQSAAATVLGALLVRSFGWSWSSGVVFGIALSVASTVVLVRVLSDNNTLHTRSGHISVGWLVAEDLFTVIALVLLPMIFGQAGHDRSFLASLGLMVLKVVTLIFLMVVVGSRFVPRLLDYVAAVRSRELFTLTVLVIALGIAVGSAKVFGVSMALGAFLAGLVVGRSDYSLRAASEALPLRDAFAVLFFVSVGMLLSPGALLNNPLLIAGTLAVVVLGKPAVAFGITWLMRCPFATSLSVALSLAQIGEFSFMLSRVGADLGLLTDTAMHTIVATAIISITLNPLLYRLIDPVEAWVAHRPRLWGWLTTRAPALPPPEVALTPDGMSAAGPHHRAVVVGYGPVGQTVTRLLQDNHIAPTIIELNRDTVRCLREAGVSVVYGDARHREILQGAGVGSAGSLILSAAGLHASAEVIRLARELNPAIRILARAAYVRDSSALHQAGAEYVFSGEGEVALAMTEALLRSLGATPEQIDRERERVHRELVGGPTIAARQDTPLDNWRPARAERIWEGGGER